MNSSSPRGQTGLELDEQPVQASLNLRHYWYVILERRWLIIASFLFIVGLSVAYIYFQPKEYQARVRLQINPRNFGFGDLQQDGSMMGGASDVNYLPTMYKKLTGIQLLTQVRDNLKLTEDPRYAKQIDQTAALLSDIRVDPVRMTLLVDVSVRHNRSKRAAEIANEIAEVFITQNKEERSEVTTDRISYLVEEKEKLKRELEVAEAKLNEFAEQEKYLSDGRQNIVAEALSRAQSVFADALGREKAAETLFLQYERHIASNNPAATFPSIAANGQINQLQMQLVSLQNERAALKDRYKDKHPSVIQVNSRIDEATKAIARIARLAADTLHTEAEIAGAQRKAAEELVGYWQGLQADWIKSKMKYDQQARDVDITRNLYQTAYTRLKEAEVRQKNARGNVQVADRATPPPVPAFPNTPLVLALGVLLAIGGSIGLALFVNFIDDSVKSQDDVETYLRVPFLGYIPNIHSNSVLERYLHSQLQPQSTAAESYRSLRAAISLGHSGLDLKMIAVTSTVPGEGKSITAANLAIVMAQTGLKTLLVDADLRRPWVGKAFQVSPTHALADYLLGESIGVRDLLKTTEIANLDVVCAGAAKGQTSELTASKKMARFLEEVTQMYDRVILDSPPVSAVSDALVLSAAADGVVYVVKFNKIRREHARKSMQRLLDAGAHLCGAVLNNIDFEGRDAYYYSSYYYQNRYYAEYEPEDETDNEVRVEAKERS